MTMKIKQLDNAGKRLSNAGVPSMNRATTWATGTAFLLASATQLGDAEISAFGYSLSEWLMSSAFSLGSIDVTTASTVALLSVIVGFIGTNRDLRNFRDNQTTFGFITGLAVFIMAIQPELVEWLSQTELTGFLTTVVLSLGFIAMVETGGGYN